MVYTIWVTEACNLRCKYCYEGSEKNQLHMTLETAEQVLRFMEKDFDIENEEELVVNFHGGEPFIGYKLIKFFVEELRKRYQHRCNLFFSATTNATLFTPDIIEFIQKENIAISLWGSALRKPSVKSCSTTATIWRWKWKLTAAPTAGCARSPARCLPGKLSVPGCRFW